MSAESTFRPSSKALAAEDADHSPASYAGSSYAVSEILSPTAHRITAHRPRPISAFASVTVNNSYGKCYKRKNGSNPVSVGIPFCTISYNTQAMNP
jgi:hypothetical protein